MLKKIKTANIFLQLIAFLYMSLCFITVSRAETTQPIAAIFSKQALAEQQPSKEIKQFQSGWIGPSNQQELRIDLTYISLDQMKGKIYLGSSQQAFSVAVKVSKIPHDYQYKAVLSISSLKSHSGVYTLFFDLNHPDELRIRIFKEDQEGHSAALKLLRTHITK